MGWGCTFAFISLTHVCVSPEEAWPLLEARCGTFLGLFQQGSSKVASVFQIKQEGGLAESHPNGMLQMKYHWAWDPMYMGLADP